MLPEPVPLKVGKAGYSKAGAERLLRVNILQVVSAGSEKRKESRSFAKGWLGRLAPESA